MRLVSNKLYNCIPLFNRLEAMSMKKLIKVVWKEYGIYYHPQMQPNKYDLIDDILCSITKTKEHCIKRASGGGMGG